MAGGIFYAVAITKIPENEWQSHEGSGRRRTKILPSLNVKISFCFFKGVLAATYRLYECVVNKRIEKLTKMKVFYDEKRKLKDLSTILQSYCCLLWT